MSLSYNTDVISTISVFVVVALLFCLHAPLCSYPVLSHIKHHELKTKLHISLNYVQVTDTF